MVKCHVCGSDECIKPAGQVFKEIATLYAPCSACSRQEPLDKTMPLETINLDLSYKKCHSCGKRHLDYVMAHVLSILIKAGLKDVRSNLKDIGTPMVTYGMRMVQPPRLPDKSLILILDSIDKKTAKNLLNEVPEIKGVIKRTGSPLKSIGILDTDREPLVYELLAGCDVRADIVSSMLGDFCFYREQSKTHIEFFRDDSVKIKMMEQLFLEGNVDGKVIVDGLASVGTLGIIVASGGAKKVILNDAWLPAVRDMIINLGVNSDSLGINVNIVNDLKNMVADEPVLIAKATGNVEIDVYQSDLRKLDNAVPFCDVCIIDTFPGMKPDEFVRQWKKISKIKVMTL